MKLAAKFTLVLVLGICAVMAYQQFAEVGEESAEYRTDMQNDLSSVGRLFRPTLERTWRVEGKDAALAVLAYTKQTLQQSKRASKIDMRWVSLDPAAPDAVRPQVAPALLGPLLTGQEVSTVAPSVAGEERLYSYVPLHAGVAEADRGALEVSESLAPFEIQKQRLRRRALMTTLSLVAICGLLTGTVGVLFIAWPTRKLATAVERIGNGDLSTRVDMRQRDELGTLGRGIDKMCDELRRAREGFMAEHQRCLHLLEQLHHADRMVIVGKIAAGLAHDIGTPLAVIAGRAGMIAEGSVQGDEVVSCAQNIVRQVDKMTAIIRQTLDFSRPCESTTVPGDLRALAEDTVSMLRPLARKRQVELALDMDPAASFIVRMDSSRIQHVLSNLIINALDAMDRGGTVTTGGMRQGQELCLYVEDQGKGISEDQRTRIFEPFFSTKPPGKGTGLGLSIAKEIVQEHGGRIEVQSEVGRGTRFSVYLPACDPPSQSGTGSARCSIESTRGRSTS